MRRILALTMTSLATLLLTAGMMTVSTPASAIRCIDCEPGDPPPACWTGQQAACTTSSGCEGRKTCTNGAWGACMDVGLCPRAACPADRGTVVRANPDRVAAGQMVCTSLQARAGERIQIRSISTGGNYQMKLFRNGTMVAIADTGSFDYWKRITYTVPPLASATYQACYHNTDWFFSNAMRFTMDVAGPGCDTNPDECFNAVGPGCFLCDGGQDTHGMLRYCPVRVASNTHDTCCSLHPGGEWCDGAFPADYSCTAPPGYSQEGYRCCTAEKDRGWDAGGDREWHTYMDPTIMTYRPTPTASMDEFGSWAWGSPIGDMCNGVEACLAPNGQLISFDDAEAGWCMSGNYIDQGDGDAICY